ncbi:hypothetical protein [Tenacibaculum sp. Ill]|uniref:hypothetical protein n=1 Tax=Tenacibaculum sp. Ill TaxID=3445935 RepID=UPI003F799892
MKKRKKQIANLLKLGVFLFGVSLLLWSCEKQEEVNHGLENEHFGIPQKYFKKKITLKEVLSNEELYNVLEKNFIRSSEQKKVNEFIPYNYILKVYTSQGILFYNDTIKTYTFPIITNLEKEEHSFFNLLFQEYKGKLYVGVIKYTPSSNWLSNKKEKYEGSFELIDKEGRSKKSYASKSSCETILKAFYAPCGCGGSANGHAPSGAWCCKGSPLLGYDMEFSCSGGGSNGEPGDLDGVSGGLDSGGSSGSAQTDPTEAIYTDTALGINKSLGGTLSDSELEWIDTHPLESFKIVNFIIANEDENKQLTSEAKTFAEQAIKALANGGEVDFDDRIINEIKDEKIKCLHDKLTKDGNTFVKDLLANFEGVSEFNINISSVDKIFSTNVNDYVNGETSYTKGDDMIYIKISADKISNNSVLSGIRTILHEYIHADMFRKLYTKEGISNSDIKDFKETYNKFKSENFKPNNLQHESMAKLYVNSMATALKEIHQAILLREYNYLSQDGAKSLDNLYEALAWQGLKGHDVQAYTELSDTKKKALKEALDIYFYSLTKNCPQ